MILLLFGYSFLEFTDFNFNLFNLLFDELVLFQPFSFLIFAYLDMFIDRLHVYLQFSANLIELLLLNFELFL